MLIRQERFGGPVPKVANNLLAPNMASEAKNCDFNNGNLRALLEPEQIWTPTKAGTIKSIFKYVGNFWFHWLEEIHLIKSPLAAETDSRVYFTGDGVPKFTDATIATSGGDTYPTNSWPLELPYPPTAPTFAAGAGGGCAVEEQSERFYVVTFMRTMGGITEESIASPASNSIDMCPDQEGDLSDIPVPPAGYNITHVGIYRRVTGGNLHRVGTIAAGVTVFNDNLTDIDAAEQVAYSSEDNDPVPDDLRNLILLPNGCAAGISGKAVRFSLPYLVHAWPTRYSYAFQEEPVAIGAFGNSVVVLLPGEKPQILAGTDPGGMGQEFVELEQTCESARSVAALGGNVVYAAPDGLCGVGPGMIGVLTKDLIDRKKWRELNPSSILGVVHDRKYFGFYEKLDGTKGGFIVEPENQLAPWQTIDIHATAAWSDKATDSLYLVVDGEIVRYNTGANYMERAWSSRQYNLPSRSLAAVAKVDAVDYDDITLVVYVDGKEKTRLKVHDDEPFWLPDGYTSRRFKFQILGTSEVEDLVVADNIDELEKI